MLNCVRVSAGMMEVTETFTGFKEFRDRLASFREAPILRHLYPQLPGKCNTISLSREGFFCDLKSQIISCYRCGLKITNSAEFMHDPVKCRKQQNPEGMSISNESPYAYFYS